MLLHWIWLSTRPRLNGTEKLALLQHFQDPEALYQADAARLEGLNLPEKKQEALLDKDLGESRQILSRCAAKKIGVLTFQEEAYPQRLKTIPDPPLVLYYTGKLPRFDELPVIGVVGTRKASTYGLSSAKRLSTQLSACGATVVSGMAFGIDSMAIAGALTSETAPVGILGCGVDIVYPASNRELFSRMGKGGCLISEYPPGTYPRKWFFPQRNRLISGVSCGVLVVEAPEQSGALITARQALEQGRDVFVVPGNIDVASCAGSNALLRDGAIPVSSGWDVVREYTHQFPDKLHKAEIPVLPDREPALLSVAQNTAFLETSDKIDIDKDDTTAYSGVSEQNQELSQDEQTILALLRRGVGQTDELVAQAGMDAGTAMSVLTVLEIKGMVQTLPGKRVYLII